MIDRETRDRLIEDVLKEIWPGAYDCDDPYDDCQDFIDDDREMLRKAADDELRDLGERLASHGDGGEHDEELLTRFAAALLDAMEEPDAPEWTCAECGATGATGFIDHIQSWHPTSLEPDAPVLVWRDEGWCLCAGKWTIHAFRLNSVDLVMHGCAIVARGLPTLEAAKDLAARIERELRR